MLGDIVIAFEALPVMCAVSRVLKVDVCSVLPRERTRDDTLQVAITHSVLKRVEANVVDESVDEGRLSDACFTKHENV